VLLSCVGYACGLAGDRENARSALTELHALAGERYVSPMNFATIHVGLAQSDETFRGCTGPAKPGTEEFINSSRHVSTSWAPTPGMRSSKRESVSVSSLLRAI
jgi:hypothetical protein